MECFSPISLRTDKGSNVVPCGRCAACLANRRAEWSTRLELECRYSHSAYFVTLTYTDENLPCGDLEIGSLCKRDLQLFFKRLRKECPGKIKYYLTGEYGGKTSRPHYHAIIFNLPQNPLELLIRNWELGEVHVGTVTPSSIRYTLKYIMNVKKSSTLYDYVEKPFALMSKGLGVAYVEKLRSWHQGDISRNYVIREGGVKARLPRYFRDKIYSKSQKERQIKMYEKERFRFCENMEKRDYFKDEIEAKQAFTERSERSLKQNGLF